MNKKNIKRKSGFFAAGGVAIGQGLEGVLFQFLFLIFAVGIVSNNAFGTAVMAIKETIGIIISLIIFGPSLFLSVLKRLKQKQTWFIIAASTIGTAIGNVFYIFAVAQAGSSYGVILTAMYPIFSLLLIKFIMKEKENWKVWAGVFITVTSGVLFILLPTIFNSDEGFSGARFIGMILGLFAALMWALEGAFLKKAMTMKLDKNEKRFTNKEIVATRSIFSGGATYIFLMPLMMIFGNSFKFYGEIFTNWKALLIVGSIATNIIILRIIHTFALDNIGPKLTASIDTNNFLVPTLLAEILQFTLLKNTDNNFIFEPVIWWAYFLIIPIAIGVATIVYFNEDKHPEIHFEKSLE